MKKIGILTSVSGQITGPKSHTLYVFQPWASVEDIDVESLLSYRRMTKGCGCATDGSEAKEERVFASEEDILSGAIVPVWKGQFGT